MDDVDKKLYLSTKAEELKNFARNFGITDEEIEGCTSYSNYALTKKDKLALGLTRFKNSKNTRDDYLKLFRIFKECTSQGDGLGWIDVDEVLDDVIHNTVRILCPSGCNGTKDLCILPIKTAVDRGKRAFILSTAHVRDRLEELYPNYFNFEDVVHNDIAMALWITRKDANHA